MKYCPVCGKQSPDEAAFCSECGTVFENIQPVNYSANNNHSTSSSDDKIMSVLSYLGILFLVPLLMKKESPFVRFHLNQGIVVCIMSVIISVISTILTQFVSFFGIITLLPLVLQIMGIVYACKGEMKELPLIGTIKILK